MLSTFFVVVRRALGNLSSSESKKKCELYLQVFETLFRSILAKWQNENGQIGLSSSVECVCDDAFKMTILAHKCRCLAMAMAMAIYPMAKS